MSEFQHAIIAIATNNNHCFPDRDISPHPLPLQPLREHSGSMGGIPPSTLTVLMGDSSHFLSCNPWFSLANPKCFMIHIMGQLISYIQHASVLKYTFIFSIPILIFSKFEYFSSLYSKRYFKTLKENFMYKYFLLLCTKIVTQ